MRKHMFTAIVVVTLSLTSCSDAGNAVLMPAPEKLSAQETEAIRAFMYLDEISAEPIGWHNGRPLVRVYNPGVNGAGKARYDAAGVSIITTPDWKGWILFLYDFSEDNAVGSDGTKLRVANIYDINTAYINGMMSRDDILDARERMISLGLALPDTRSPAPLTDSEFSGIVSAYEMQYRKETGKTWGDPQLTLMLVGRYGGHPLVYVDISGRIAIEGRTIVIGGLTFSFPYSGMHVCVYDGSELVSLEDAYAAGLIGGDELADARDSMIQMTLVIDWENMPE